MAQFSWASRKTMVTKEIQTVTYTKKYHWIRKIIIKKEKNSWIYESKIQIRSKIKIK